MEAQTVACGPVPTPPMPTPALMLLSPPACLPRPSCWLCRDGFTEAISCDTGRSGGPCRMYYVHYRIAACFCACSSSQCATCGLFPAFADPQPHFFSSSSRSTRLGRRLCCRPTASSKPNDEGLCSRREPSRPTSICFGFGDGLVLKLLGVDSPRRREPGWAEMVSM